MQEDGQKEEQQPTQETEKTTEKKKDEVKFNLRDTLLAFTDLPRIMRLVWGASPLLVMGMAVLMLVMGLVPLAQTIAARLIIDGALEGINRGSLEPIIFPVILELIINLTHGFSRRLHTSAQALLNQRLSDHMMMIVLNKTSSLDLAHFENAEFYDRLNRATKEVSGKPMEMIIQLFSLGSGLITLISLMGLLLQLSWWIALVALIVSIPLFLVDNRFGLNSYWMNYWRSPKRRQQWYIIDLLTTDSFNKEIKLFNLAHLFKQRYQNLSNQMYEEDKQLQHKSIRFGLLGLLLPVLATSGIYLYIALQAIERRISLGALIQYTVAITQVSEQFQGLLHNLSEMYQYHLFIKTLFDFLALEPKILPPDQPDSLNSSSNSNGLSIELRNVSFTYPGKGEPTLKDINFTMRAGESIALVGLNGAGKTTLVKLLTRLYDPDDGEILINGRNIKEYDPADLREQIGVIFQDFVKYNMTALENIGIGRVTEIKNYELIEKAAHKSGAHEVITPLEEGYDTMLGHWFEKGVNLSGGEWQKIALARAFVRDAPLLVLDEPTSSLDAQAEYDIFQRFRHLTIGRTVIFISHRFSTVRLADRIFVIEEGTILESGSHQELLNLQGRYADLFHLQAEAYR